MARLLDPQRSVAIILGAHDWTRAGMATAPSFRRSAAHFHAYLVRQPPQGLGLEPDLVVSLFDDPAPAGAQLVRIRDTVRSLIGERKASGDPIRDVLIYYVGHGTCEAGRQLNLLVRDSAEGIEAQSSIAAPDLAQVLRVAAPQQRRLVILDCCFSEAAAEAFGAMGALDEAVAAAASRDLAPHAAPPERGTVLLCSSPRGRFSIGLPDAERTLFTGAMLSVLGEGAGWRPAMLSFSDLREEIHDRMLRDFGTDPPRPALHQPDQQEGDLTRLPAFPNAATRGVRSPARAPMRREGEHAPEVPIRDGPATNPQESMPPDTQTRPDRDLDSEAKGGPPSEPSAARWRQTIVDACKKFGGSAIATGAGIPTAQLVRARKAFAIPLTEEVLALANDTIFESNQTGLAFSIRGLYGTYVRERPDFLSWSKLATCIIRQDHSSLSFHEGRSIRFSSWASYYVGAAAALLKHLQTHPDRPR